MENERHTFEVIRNTTRNQAISDIEDHIDRMIPAVSIEQGLHEDVKKMTYQSETSNIIYDATLMATRAVMNPACDEKIKSEVYMDTSNAIRRVFPSVLIREAVEEALRDDKTHR